MTAKPGSTPCPVPFTLEETALVIQALASVAFKWEIAEHIASIKAKLEVAHNLATGATRDPNAPPHIALLKGVKPNES